METSTISDKMHLGRKISRIREIRGIKQDYLAIELGVSQQTISKIEQSDEVDEVTLQKIADVLGISAEAIKNYNEEVVINIISSTLHDNAGSINNSCTLNFSPIDKIVELYDEKIALLERLLASEKEKVEILKNSK